MEVFLLNGESVDEIIIKNFVGAKRQWIINFIIKNRYSTRNARGGLINIQKYMNTIFDYIAYKIMATPKVTSIPFDPFKNYIFIVARSGRQYRTPLHVGLLKI